ncbi:response regulator, partial [Heliobacterium chlorum]
GSEVIALSNSNHYDLIILDIRMPDVDVLEAANQIRKLGIKTPIWFISVFSDEQIEESIRNGLASKYFCKPFDVNDFSTEVKRLFQSKKRAV